MCNDLNGIIKDLCIMIVLMGLLLISIILGKKSIDRDILSLHIRIDSTVQLYTSQWLEDLAIELNQPEFFISDTPNIYLVQRALEDYNVKHPDIVLAQAILETGNFESNVCIRYHNLFGLYNSKTKDYYRFNHWTRSIEGYIRYIQYRYKDGEDYYDFLKRIGYAEDPEYINKLKQIKLKYNL